MSLTNDHLRRIAQVAHARHLGFVDLVGLAELDPATAFRGAVLRGDLSGQDLGGFDFTEAEFSGCNLIGADLSQTEGVTLERLAHAITDGTTILPRPFFWVNGRAPSWADDWGHDEYGPWVTFRMPGTDVTQRMRWCPPGAFMMGSPNDEPDRSDDEGPRHQVILTYGFWMFDTAVTEALWATVTGYSPERPLGDAYPIARVSWYDARYFVQRLNTLIPGLSINFPSEACWEYACRAGSETRYTTDVLVQERTSAGNEWLVPVQSQPANQWGFYEVQGNVWEWCEDHYHSRYNGAPTDGSAWIDLGSDVAADRVLRGGSWNPDTFIARAACRLHRHPQARNALLGFRCARLRPTCKTSEAEHVVAPANLARRTCAHSVQMQGTPSITTVLGGIRTGHITTPAWAAAAGEDDFGRFVDITVPGTNVTQRMRWIPPGRFCMGSPENEPGRYPNEGPLHDVTLGRGFWLFDTPCTQALWSAVMQSNPSEFCTPNRPVESMTFYEVMAFIATLNERIPDLELSLPSEAQWEYACRAGTRTQTYAGKLDVIGLNNAPALDAISWYGGNSGDGFELKNGYDSNDWPEKQYSHIKAGTRPVGMKRANSWGLFDMLGNVAECCLDYWHESYQGAPTDGSAWLNPEGMRGVDRVMRGAAWNNNARKVRSAYRRPIDWEARAINVGFRCVRVQRDDEVGG